MTAANAEFLRREYSEGGKGFIFSGNRVSVWFDQSGLRIAVGDTALNADNAASLHWHTAERRIRDLLELDRFAPQSELDKAQGNELRELSEKLFFLYRDEHGSLPQEWTVNGSLYAESLPVIAEQLARPEMLEMIIRKISGDLQIAQSGALDGDFRNVNVFRRNAPAILVGLQNLQYEPRVLTADESISTPRPAFITQDEVDRVLMRGGNIEQGKFRIYAYFLQNHTAKEKADFLKNEYGTGGFSRTGFDEWHDGKGIAYSRENNHMPYDKVILPWPKVARRFSELIADGRFMSEHELAYIPEYEKIELARDIVSFYPRQPEDLPRPFPFAADFGNSVEIVREQLDQPERVTEMLTQMAAILDNTAEFDRKLRENRLNDGLIKPAPLSETPRVLYRKYLSMLLEEIKEYDDVYGALQDPETEINEAENLVADWRTKF
jgi:hypothetical protein